MLTPHELSSLIKKRSSDLGFQNCGIARSEYLENHESRIKDWLHQGLNAEMVYMENNLDKRLDPSLLFEDAKSVIVVSYNYYSDTEQGEGSPFFSKYAYGKDYHKVLKDKLYVILEDIVSNNNIARGRVFVDSAPVLERAWAVESGLGWIGKNSMLIDRKAGSYSFLGVIVTNIVLEYDEPEKNDFCGSCTRCVDACPTGAITNMRTVDSRKCISYLSIEKKGDFEEKNTSLHGYVFGCDICQDVCPWNNKVNPATDKNFSILPEIESYKLDDWKKITEEEFNIIFRNSPVLRTGYNGFIRNLMSL